MCLSGSVTRGWLVGMRTAFNHLHQNVNKSNYSTICDKYIFCCLKKTARTIHFPQIVNSVHGFYVFVMGNWAGVYPVPQTSMICNVHKGELNHIKYSDEEKVYYKYLVLITVVSNRREIFSIAPLSPGDILNTCCIWCVNDLNQYFLIINTKNMSSFDSSGCCLIFNIKFVCTQ